MGLIQTHPLKMSGSRERGSERGDPGQGGGGLAPEGLGHSPPLLCPSVSCGPLGRALGVSALAGSTGGNGTASLPYWGSRGKARASHWPLEAQCPGGGGGPSCNREEPNLTTCWICFFYFNLRFLLLLFTKRILSLHNGLPRETPPLCLNVKLKCLCSGRHPDPVYLWMAARKKKLTHPLPEAGQS